MSSFISGQPPGFSLDDLSNVSGFNNSDPGSFAFKNEDGIYVPQEVSTSGPPIGLGLEYVDGLLQVKVSPTVSRIQLTTDGLIAMPNQYLINFSKKGIINNFNLSTGDAESYSFGSYVVPLDSLIVGGSCVCTKNKLPVVNECKAAIIYNGMKTEMVIQKNANDVNGLVIFNPRILVKAGSTIGLIGLQNINADCTGYSVYLTSLNTITNTVKVRKCTTPVSVVNVTNPELPTDIVPISSVPMVPV